MQTRRMILALFVSIAVFYVWSVIASTFLWPQPRRIPHTQPATTTAPTTTTATAAANEDVPTHAQFAAATAPAPVSQPSNVKISGGQDATPITMGSAEAGSLYPMALELTPRGAAVASARIRGHYETVTKKETYQILEPAPPLDRLSGHEDFHSFTTKIRFDNLNMDVPLDDVLWTVSPQNTETHKIFSVQVNTVDGRPLARMTKTYDLQPQTAKPKEQTYDLGLSLQIENLSGAPLRFILTQSGPVGFRKEDQRTDDRRVVSGVWLDEKIVIKGHVRTDVFEKTTVELGTDTESKRIAWAAETNKYFACIMAPTGRTGPKDPVRFAKVEAVDFTQTPKKADPDVIALTFQYITTPRDLPAGGSEQIGFNCYIGPKSKKSFENVPQYKALDYYGVISEGFYACAPAGLVKLMMVLLDTFYDYIPPHNYGIAIIVLVLVVRALLHPITKRSQVNMMKMQKKMSVLQPKQEAIKQKYAGDKVKMNQAIMELYRDAGVNPAGNILTCLPMFLQIPIWGALWTALASTIEMRHAPFDGYWIKNLAGQDAIWAFNPPLTVPLISFFLGPIHSLNILPILLGFSQLLQAKYMPRGNPSPQSSSSSDQMEQQRKMMMIYMPILMVLMLYNAPSGLNLYIMASNFFGVFEQWRIRKHIADEEKKLAEQPIVFTERLGEPAEPKKPSWLQSKWLELQKQADEARKQESQRPKKKPKDS